MRKKLQNRESFMTNEQLDAFEDQLIDYELDLRIRQLYEYSADEEEVLGLVKEVYAELNALADAKEAE